MRKCLLLISLTLLTLVGWAQTPLLPIEGKCHYQVTIAARGTEITGVCIINSDEEGCKGVLVNEFGIHVMDFTVSPDRRKVKLLNVMPFMNRWYIKRVVKGDLKFLFGATQEKMQKGKRTITIEDNGTVTLVNSRYGLRYSFLEMDNRDDETSK